MAFEKTDAKGFLKDSKTGVVINNNMVELDQILAAREKKNRERDMEQKVERLESDILDIKSMLTQLLQKATP